MRLPETLNVTEVSRLQARLQELLEGDGPIRLDAAGVDVVDTAGIQLLVAFAREVRSRGRPLVWHEPAAALRRTAALLGLSSALGLGESS